MKITVPISVGELLDKITILEIKTEHTNNHYVIKELNDLNKIRTKVPQQLDSELNELREVNRTLWKIEDCLREKEKYKNFDDEFVQLARQVYITNDKRAQIKAKINEITQSAYKEIKLHK